MKYIKKNLIQVFLWLMLGLIPQFAWAEVPNVINYQGYLTDSSGNPLNGTVNVTLTFWDASTGGNTLGSPKSYSNVEVNNGVFSTNVAVSDITLDGLIFLELTVNGETLAPRQLVTSVPFAYRANTAADADTLDGLDSSEFITSETDPTVPADLKDGVSWDEVVNRPTGLDDGDDVGITAETDPEVGSNTTNYVPKWNGSALVTGTIYDNGKVGIGTTSPSNKLEVAGKIEADHYCDRNGQNCQSATELGGWPSGNYCIFANGACPAGFTRHEGYMKAISLYSGNSGYIKQATFGSSKINCHGSCGQYGSWTGELHLQICCK